MSCPQFVEWIAETGVALGWPRFRDGFLKMLNHAASLSIPEQQAAEAKLAELEIQLAEKQKVHLLESATLD